MINERERIEIPVRRHPDLASFYNMLQRCLNPRSKAYSRYGGRGITVCDRWRKGGFRVFIADMGPRPSLRYSIDRVNNDGNYEPGNCRWATKKEQNRNRRDNRVIEFRGQRRSVAEWGEVTGLGESCVRLRLNRGWSVERSLTAPADNGLHHRKYSPDTEAALRARVAAGESIRSAARALGISNAAYRIIARQDRP